MAEKVKVDNFANSVRDVLARYEDVVESDVREAVTEAAKMAVDELKGTSPRSKKHRNKNKKGNDIIYANEWTSREYKTNAHKVERVVYNKRAYRLTHLLENGHIVVDRNRNVHGKASPQPHIANAEERAVAKYEHILQEKLKK